MPEEKKELQNEDVENVSGGGLSLEKAKKFAKKHKKALIGTGVAALATAGAVGGKKLYDKKKEEEYRNDEGTILLNNLGDYADDQRKEEVARSISPQNEKNFYDKSKNEEL